MRTNQARSASYKDRLIARNPGKCSRLFEDAGYAREVRRLSSRALSPLADAGRAANDYPINRQKYADRKQCMQPTRPL